MLAKTQGQFAEVWHRGGQGVSGGNDQQNQVMAVVTLPEGCHVQHLNEQYMRSQAFREDMAGFPVANIIRVEEMCISETLF